MVGVWWESEGERYITRGREGETDRQRQSEKKTERGARDNLITKSLSVYKKKTMIMLN